MPELGKLRSIGLRNAWPNEAKDFTPWLADNIEELGDALDMRLVMLEPEAAVGRLSLDILARDLKTNRTVIIENQLGPTDHKHLGQLIAYAAGYDANAIIWLTAGLRDEYRQALDWLNQRTREETLFFGVVVELWQIGDSQLAPHFKPVVVPNNWQKHSSANSGATASAATLETAQRYRDFWQKILDGLQDQSFARSRSAWHQSYFPFSIGHSTRVQLRLNFVTRGQVKVETYIDSQDPDWNIMLLDRLEENRELIESELGYALEWQRAETNRYCRIAYARSGAITDEEESLAEIRSWMIENLLKFKRIFELELQSAVQDVNSQIEEQTTSD